MLTFAQNFKNMSSTSSHSILVPIDSTEQTIIALHQSYNLARLTNSKIVLMSVEEDEAHESEKRLQHLALEVSKESGQPVETMMRKGNVYEEIIKVADVINPLFIVIGLTSKITLGKIIGQNAFKMVRESKHPVITIRGKHHREGCKTILLPLDLTKQTREKVGKAIELAKLFNSTIRIISILTEKNEEAENRLISYSNQVWKYIREEGIKCSIKTLRGKDAPEMILNYAHEVEADIILIMSKAELSVREMFIGTTAQRIINESDIPVVSIRPMERKDTSVFNPY
jgi:nucleotide-binding universal stress UspA family protein